MTLSGPGNTVEAAPDELARAKAAFVECFNNYVGEKARANQAQITIGNLEAALAIATSPLPEDRASMFIDWCALHGFGLQGWPEGAHAQLVAHMSSALSPLPEGEVKGLVAELKQFHAEIIESDGGESGQMVMTRRAFETLEHQARALAETTVERDELQRIANDLDGKYKVATGALAAERRMREALEPVVDAARKWYASWRDDEDGRAFGDAEESDLVQAIQTFIEFLVRHRAATPATERLADGRVDELDDDAADHGHQ